MYQAFQYLLIRLQSANVLTGDPVSPSKLLHSNMESLPGLVA